ncbi:hypothetical protein [Nannocystis pusilla]|uniref:Uncharacterized protein n=1 Tax=Nannocystis pusilla TaxID=889268 RepID=A0ABS7U3L3_9BACT|nr:hypothetical protein [Nannocystis pusilla]MBZ5715055.1 hypothetical protein [Nannocystis pusilla]
MSCTRGGDSGAAGASTTTTGKLHSIGKLAISVACAVYSPGARGVIGRHTRTISPWSSKMLYAASPSNRWLSSPAIISPSVSEDR